MIRLTPKYFNPTTEQENEMFLTFYTYVKIVNERENSC